jgi:hypothetical protein
MESWRMKLRFSALRLGGFAPYDGGKFKTA